MSDLFVNKIRIAGESFRVGYKFIDGEFPTVGYYVVDFIANENMKKADLVEALKLLAEKIEQDIPKPDIVEDGKQKYSGGMDFIPYFYDKKRVYFFEEQL